MKPPHEPGHPIDPAVGGLLLVDKPVNWTSFDAVGKVRGALHALAGRRVKVGHGGTLDPLASGLLILAFGPRTKELPLLTGLDKTYVGTMTLGEVTPSYDGETDPVDAQPWQHVGEAQVRQVLTRFQGPQMQRPPLFSAKRHQGERGYHLARGGSQVRMEPVPVVVHQLEMIAMEGRTITFETTVSKGTYIRSLVHDIGQALGCGAWLSALRRTRIDRYDVTHALAPADWSQRIAPR